MDRLQKLGRDLGYEGKDLQDFVAQVNKRERDERAVERETEKAKNSVGRSENSAAARN